MWLNKFLTPVKNIFVGPCGMRGVWRVLIALVAYYLWITLATAVLTLVFASLFDAWGVNTLNLHLAPRWVRTVVSGYPYAISLAVNVPAALVMTRLSRKKSAPRPVHAMYFSIGMAAAAVPCALFLLADSLRALPSAPEFHWAIILNLPVCMAAAWSEQALARDLVPSLIRGRFRTAVAYAASAAAIFLITRAWEAGVVGAINLILMAILLMSVTGLKGSLSAAALRAGWMWTAGSILGMTDAEISLIPLYPVSETLLTGGTGGLICGLATTIILIDAIILIHKKQLKFLIKKTPAA